MCCRASIPVYDSKCIVKIFGIMYTITIIIRKSKDNSVNATDYHHID